MQYKHFCGGCVQSVSVSNYRILCADWLKDAEIVSSWGIPTDPYTLKSLGPGRLLATFLCLMLLFCIASGESLVTIIRNSDLKSKIPPPEQCWYEYTLLEMQHNNRAGLLFTKHFNF